MKKYYVVQENGYEYNDENYHRPETEGGCPKSVYLSKEDAEKSARELNIMAFAKIESPFEYVYDSSEIFGRRLPESFYKEWKKIFPDVSEEDPEMDAYAASVTYKIPRKASREQLGKVVDLCKAVKFFEVVEVPEG